MSAEIERSNMRMSNTDREQVVEHLQSCAGDGRLSLDEFADRVDRVYAAKTFGELAPLLSDLPELGNRARSIDFTPEEELAPTASSVKRTGRWLVPRKLVLRPKASGVKLDFSRAVIGHREVEIEVDAKASSITLVLPRDGWAEDNVDLHAGSVVNKAHYTGEHTGVGFRVRGRASASSLTIRRLRRFLWWEY